MKRVLLVLVVISCAILYCVVFGMQVQNSATNTIEEQTVNSHKTDAPKKNLETQEVAEVFAADTAENESDSNYLSQLGRNLDQKLSSSLVKLLSFLE